MEDLYPIEFEGKMWKEEDCDDIFVSFYHSRDSLDEMMSVYLSEGDRIQPDGTWI